MNNVLCRLYVHRNARPKNQGFELEKYKNASIIRRFYMPHYIRQAHLLGECLISEV